MQDRCTLYLNIKRRSKIGAHYLNTKTKARLTHTLPKDKNGSKTYTHSTQTQKQMQDRSTVYMSTNKESRLAHTLPKHETE